MKRLIRSSYVPLPTKPGIYFWTEWGDNVVIYLQGRTLYVKPPISGAIPIKITPYIAGDFLTPRNFCPTCED